MLNIKKLNITTKKDFYFYTTGIAAIMNINFLSPMADLDRAGYPWTGYAWRVDTGHFLHTGPAQCLFFKAYFNVKNPKFGPFLRASEAGKKK